MNSELPVEVGSAASTFCCPNAGEKKNGQLGREAGDLAETPSVISISAHLSVTLSKNTPHYAASRKAPESVCSVEGWVFFTPVCVWGTMGRVSSKMASAQRSKAHQEETSKNYVRNQPCVCRMETYR